MSPFNSLRRCLATIACCIAAPTFASNDASLYDPASCHEIARAGYPHCLSILAIPSNTCAYDGYYVGGGALGCGNECRCQDQGTWGWDYFGRCFTRRVRLGWTHPPREQGGPGNYAPDGPRPCEKLKGE
jgi:hypothetical protein